MPPPFQSAELPVMVQSEILIFMPCSHRAPPLVLGVELPVKVQPVMVVPPR